MKTPEEKKEYYRIKTQESRARKKALGLPLNNPESNLKAQKKYQQKKPQLNITIKAEILENFDKKAQSMNMTSEQLFNQMYFEYFGKENTQSI
jgi:translation initiation factor 2 beta subunit (eIF-2beta)/eIF-5